MTAGVLDEPWARELEAVHAAFAAREAALQCELAELSAALDGARAEALDTEKLHDRVARLDAELAAARDRHDSASAAAHAAAAARESYWAEQLVQAADVHRQELVKISNEARSRMDASLAALAAEHELTQRTCIAALTAAQEAASRREVALRAQLDTARLETTEVLAKEQRTADELKAEIAQVRDLAASLHNENTALLAATGNLTRAASMEEARSLSASTRLAEARALLAEVSTSSLLGFGRTLRRRMRDYLATGDHLPEAAFMELSTLFRSAAAGFTPERPLVADPTDLPALLALPGLVFVRATYRIVLGREPDPTGLSFYRARLLEGVGKLDVIEELADSAEARTRSVQLAGLSEALFDKRRRRSGPRGVLARLVGSLLDQTRLVRHVNRLQAQLEEQTLEHDQAWRQIREDLARSQPLPDTAPPDGSAPARPRAASDARARAYPIAANPTGLSPLQQLEINERSRL